MAADRTVLIGQSAINRGQALLWSEHFGVCPIVTWIDAEAEETDDADAAVIGVAKLAENCWAHIDLRDYASAEAS